ncbi:tyrosinase 2 [Colletotrichum incanum]|nr:tyrosinase 2 [Colletotrichum incanum]
MITPQFALVFGVLAVVQWSTAAREIPIIGVRSGINTRTGEMPIRRDINSLYNERGMQWDLYIGALAAMQDANETDPTSYFQVAGIHGQPYIAWSGGGPQTGAEAGYCPHNVCHLSRRQHIDIDQLVPSKHCLAPGIAATSRFTRLVQPFHKLRFPLLGLTPLQQVLVHQAKLIAISYPEPYKQKYVEAAESLRIAYWDWAADHHVPPVTVMPTVVINKTVSGKIQPTAVQNPLYRFKYPRSVLDGKFGAFDGMNYTKRCVKDGENYPTTANEKLANYTLKERVDATMHFSYASSEMFATPAGTIVTPNYPIWPFMGSGGSPLTSESVTHVRDWGYTYEPMRFWDQAPGETKMAVSRTVNSLYGPLEQQKWQKRYPFKGLRRRKGIPNREYFAKVEVERSELELPCQVQLFLKGKLAGSFTLLDMPKEGMSYDTIPLRRGIDALGVNGLSTKSVLGAIEDGLQVVISKLDGTTTSLNRVPSLKIEVEDVDVVPPDSLNELPKLGAARTRTVMARPLAIGNC